MSRPRSISDEEILEAARAVFAERGVSATTAAIARRAGVSEGTLFKRFQSKDDLMIAALAPASDVPWLALLSELAGVGDVRENLERIAHEQISFFLVTLPKLFLMFTCHLPPSTFFRTAGEPLPVRALRELTLYFDAEIRCGRLRQCDPEVCARAMLGAMKDFAFAEHFGMNERLPMARATWVRGWTDQFLRGVSAPCSSDHAAKDGAPRVSK